MTVSIYRHTDPSRICAFLAAYEPYSSTILERIRYPLNHDREVFYGATFPEDLTNLEETKISTVMFADREQRTSEPNLYIFNSLFARSPIPLNASEGTTPASDPGTSIPELLVQSYTSPEEKETVGTHLVAIIQCLKTLKRADGTEYDSLTKIASLHPLFRSHLASVCGELSLNTAWLASIIELPLKSGFERPRLPEEYSQSTVQERDVEIVLSTSSIKRHKATVLSLLNSAVYRSSELVAWAYRNIDGTLATLFVQPEHRGKGLARFVVHTLLEKIWEEKQALGAAKAYVTVEFSASNIASRKVIDMFDAQLLWESAYVALDLQHVVI